jgi:putative hemolysin
MNTTVANVGIVAIFILAGGLFAGAEMALVSLREGQVRALAARGARGARVARLHRSPNRFLAAVQIGVTLAGFLSAAFGAATLADDITPLLIRAGLPPGAAGTVALIGVTLIISYFSLVLGELVPKRLALQRAETLALAVSPSLDRIATLFRPVIWLLSRSTDVVVRLLGGDPKAARDVITEEELRDIVAAHQTLGFEERALISDVFDAGQRQLHEVMVPRTEVTFLDAMAPVQRTIRELASSPHSRYPVVRGSPDEIVGFVHVRDLFDPALAGRSVRVGEIARRVMMLPGTKRVLPALSEMRRGRNHLAIVVDEYGGTDGIVTMEDLMEEVIGEIHDEYDAAEDQTKDLLDGDVEVDGLLNLEDFADRTGVTLPEGPYETVAGFLMAELGRLPEAGDSLERLGHRFVVTELDGRRVARVRLTAVPPPGEPDMDVAPEAAGPK